MTRVDRVDNELSAFNIEVNSFQAAALLSMLWDSENSNTKRAMNSVIQQLIEIFQAIKEKAGVTTEKLANGTIKMTSKDGTTIIRTPYEWEK